MKEGKSTEGCSVGVGMLSQPVYGRIERMGFVEWKEDEENRGGWMRVACVTFQRDVVRAALSHLLHLFRMMMMMR